MFSNEERCDFSDLIKSQCAHCHPPTPHEELAMLTSPPRASEFTVRFSFSCPKCDEHVEIGELAAYVTGHDMDGPICEECARRLCGQAS